MIEEVQTARKTMKDGEASCPNNINVFFKLLNDSVKWLTDIYNSVDIPHEWLKSEFVTLPKKTGAKLCGDYR